MIRRLLRRVTDRLPCRAIEIDGWPYLNRYYVGQVAGATVYLHEFLDADGDRAVHDHPWRWSGALVLAGGYTEERVWGLCPLEGIRFRLRRLFPGRINVLTPRALHRIAHVTPGTWTLFLHGQRVKGWGFLECPGDHLNGNLALLYHQPLEIGNTHWWRTAPSGHAVRAMQAEARHKRRMEEGAE